VSKLVGGLLTWPRFRSLSGGLAAPVVPIRVFGPFASCTLAVSSYRISYTHPGAGMEVVSCWVTESVGGLLTWRPFHAPSLWFGACLCSSFAFSGLSKGLYPARVAMVISPPRSGFPLRVSWFSGTSSDRGGRIFATSFGVPIWVTVAVGVHAMSPGPTTLLHVA